nr:reverse transcriptase domain, zinc finger, CCHC-type [Tanacetum cinerariifolium]
MASQLKVNFNKNSLFGIGIDNDELEEVQGFRKRRDGHLPFVYLGLPV